MEFRVLQYFLAIAREETISKAAESLHITQPPLSRQMKELEEQLGKQLFIRGNRKINLTEEGILLRQRAEEIISLVEKIENGLIDFGVLIEPADISKYDFIKIPVKDKWGVLMRKDSPIASLKSITADTLKKLPLICSSQEIVKNEISGWLNDDYNKLNIVATYNLIYNASLLVEEGSGYALGLDKLINTSGNSKLCFIPLEPKLEVGLTLIWKKYHLFSKAASYFLNQLRKEINKS